MATDENVEAVHDDLEATGRDDKSEGGLHVDSNRDGSSQQDDGTATTTWAKEEEYQAQPSTPAQKVYGWFISDVLLFTVVINLAAELVKSIIVNSFGISILYAILLKVLLFTVEAVCATIKDMCCTAPKFGFCEKFLAGIVIYMIMISSKFLIMWIDEVIFGKWVHLGHLWEVLVLAIVLLIVQRLSRLIYHQLGRDPLPWYMRPLYKVVGTENFIESRLHYIDRVLTPFLSHPIDQQEQSTSNDDEDGVEGERDD